MFSAATISNATELIIAKAPVALWLTILFLRLVDRRVITAGQCVLLGLVGTVLCAGQAWGDYQAQHFLDAANSAPNLVTNSEANQTSPFWNGALLRWTFAGIFFVVQTVVALQSWVGISARAVHASEKVDEPQDTQRKKKKRRAAVDEHQRLHSCGRFELLWLGVGLLLLGYLGWKEVDVLPMKDFSSHRFALLHLLGSTVLFSCALFCALELTFYVSPDNVAQKDATGRFLVRWRALAWIAQVAFLAEIGLVTMLMLKVGGLEAEELQAQVLTAGFAMAVALLCFVAWMVPSRLRAFQAGKPPTGWASLALAAWLSVLSLVVIAVLPLGWPWENV